MSNAVHNRLAAKLKEREDTHQMRTLNLYDDGLINLANNDYFNLSHYSKLKEAAIDDIHTYGNSSSASPLLSGFKTAHHELT